MILAGPAVSVIQICGMKNFKPPPTYDHIELPEKPKLKFIDKVPNLPPNIRPPKMQKRLRYMRGPEDVHNFLLHKQYGIMALGGGRLKWGHFEMIRLSIGRKMDANRMFAVWRVDSPWQPVTRRGQGTRLGGGKGAIDHYVTPVKAGRIIIEFGGKCDFKEVEPFLTDIANKLPFKAMVVSEKIIDKMNERENWEKENNINPYSMKYMIQNNMGGCHQWISPWDLKYFCKYI
ncbi:large ribosomal subunit protein uL16m isoform X2 [Euwallacea fornicatus]|uniref:large ribosomal subunit protein uL16m isoform X2 n=1 Tax=Euwallacea fornicatus TaxID=995702 RepID=UPI00338E1B8E